MAKREHIFGHSVSDVSPGAARELRIERARNGDLVVITTLAFGATISTVQFTLPECRRRALIHALGGDPGPASADPLDDITCADHSPGGHCPNCDGA